MVEQQELVDWALLGSLLVLVTFGLLKTLGWYQRRGRHDSDARD